MIILRLALIRYCEMSIQSSGSISTLHEVKAYIFEIVLMIVVRFVRAFFCGSVKCYRLVTYIYI